MANPLLVNSQFHNTLLGKNPLVKLVNEHFDGNARVPGVFVSGAMPACWSGGDEQWGFGGLCGACMGRSGVWGCWCLLGLCRAFVGVWRLCWVWGEGAVYCMRGGSVGDMYICKSISSSRSMEIHVHTVWKSMYNKEQQRSLVVTRSKIWPENVQKSTILPLFFHVHHCLKLNRINAIKSIQIKASNSMERRFDLFYSMHRNVTGTLLW